MSEETPENSNSKSGPDTETSAVEPRPEARESTAAPPAEPSEEELLRLFIGPNADKFIVVYRAQQQKSNKVSFNWVVFFASLPWFFYRKLYLIGVCVLLVPVVLITVFPDLADVASIGIAAGLAFSANMIYVWIALRRINKLKALGLPPDELKERIQRTGGTSPAGAAFGVLIFLSIIALQFLPATPTASAALPQCGDPTVQKATKDNMIKRAPKAIQGTDWVKLSDFEQINSAQDKEERLCSFSVYLGPNPVTMYLSVTSENEKRRRIRLRVGRTLNDISS